jgi:lysophospholipase L1-like esterase
MVGNLGGLPLLNTEVRNVARQTGAWLVDAEAIFAEDSLAAGRLDLYMDDDCHPNPAGHRRLAEALVAVLQGVNLHDD